MSRKPRLPLRFESLEDRLTPALALDPTFGVEGRTFITPGPIPQYGQITDAVVRPDGKIWAVGAVGANPILARFNANGELDRTFDEDGVVSIQPWSNAINSVQLNKLALQADGRVVLAGSVNRYTTSPTASDVAFSIYPGPYYNTDTDLLAVRLNADGTLDTTFGDGGRTTIDLGGTGYGYPAANLLAVRALADGRVILAGNEYAPVYPAYAADTLRPANTAALSIPPTPSVPNLIAARLTADGKLDVGYDGDGTAVISTGDGNIYPYYGYGITSAAVLADGRVVFAAARATPYSQPQSSPLEVFAGAYRLAADGSRDATFGGDGYAETRVASLAVPPDGNASLHIYQQFVGVQPDGQAVVAVTVSSSGGGPNTYSTSQKLYAARFTAAGDADGAFGDAGVAVVATLNTEGSAYDTPAAFAALPDGRLAMVVTTTSTSSTTPRTTSTVTLFAADGQSKEAYTLPAPARGDGLNATFLVADGGRLLLGGSTEYAGPRGSRPGLVRLANDPAPASPAANNQNPVGRFVATAGTQQINLDPGFGNGSPVFLATDLGPLYGTAVAQVADAAGRYLVLGTLSNVTVVARFNADGTLDATFDGDGVRPLLTSNENESLYATQLALQADGKILVAGTRSVYTPGTSHTDNRTFVRRLTADGSDDTAFGDGGVALLGAVGANSYESVLKVGQTAAGGVVIVTQLSEYGNLVSRLTLTARRLNADGTPDQGYGTNGAATVVADAELYSQVGGAAVLADGAVVATLTRQTGGHSGTGPVEVYLRVIRVAANGSRDTAFDGDGVAETLLDRTTPPGGFSTYVSSLPPLLAVQPGGAVVVGTQLTTNTNGSTGDPSGNTPYLTYFSNTTTRFVAVRFTAAGQRDAAFGTEGTLTLDSSSTDNNSFNTPSYSYQSLIALPDGRLSLLSTTGRNGGIYPAAATTGTSVPPAAPPTVPPPPARAADLSLPYPYYAGPTSAVVRRFTADGQFDPTFDTVALSISGRRDTLSPVSQLIDADGRVVLAGGGQAGIGVERLADETVPLPSVRPTVYVSGKNGTVEMFQRAADGTLVSAGTYTPFDGYTGTVRVATGDLNGDGFTDTVFATGDSGSQVRVLLGLDPEVAPTALVAPIDFTVFEASFDGGVSVATGDIDGDGSDELVVTPNVGGSGRVMVYSLADGKPVVRANFFGIDDIDFRGGATCSLGDTDGDGKMELIVAAGIGGGPRVAIFSGRTVFSVGVGLAPPKLMNDFFAFPGADAERLRNGVTVTAGDINGDGVDDIVFGGGEGGGARVYTVDGKQLSAGRTVQLGNFFVGGNESTRGGVRLALKDLDGDGRPDLIANATGGMVRAYNGSAIAQPNAVEPGLLAEFESAMAPAAEAVYVG